MASPRALGPLNSASYFSRLSWLRRRSYKCFYPFHVAFAVFGDASSVTRFASAVRPLMNLHGRVDVFVGRFRCPSQAGRFDALRRPRCSSHKMVLCVPRGARERIETSELDYPLRFEGRFMSLHSSSVLSHCFSLVFLHNPRKIIHGVRVLRSSTGGFQGRPLLRRPAPDFALG
jgi:hypothetical protein